MRLFDAFIFLLKIQELKTVLTQNIGKSWFGDFSRHEIFHIVIVFFMILSLNFRKYPIF